MCVTIKIEFYFSTRLTCCCNTSIRDMQLTSSKHTLLCSHLLMSTYVRVCDVFYVFADEYYQKQGNGNGYLPNGSSNSAAYTFENQSNLQRERSFKSGNSHLPHDVPDAGSYPMNSAPQSRNHSTGARVWRHFHFVLRVCMGICRCLKRVMLSNANENLFLSELGHVMYWLNMYV